MALAKLITRMPAKVADTRNSSSPSVLWFPHPVKTAVSWAFCVTKDSFKMKRVFLVDVLKCENCGGPMKMIAAIDQPKDRWFKGPVPNIALGAGGTYLRLM